MPRETRRQRVCFVTGTRAEFGLMASTLRALRAHVGIELQLVVTGSHTQKSRGETLGAIRREGWKIDAVVRWPDDTSGHGIARATGQTMGRLADVFSRLSPDIVLVVGDRVEAFAAASAAHISGRVVAHVHGGDRAMGQVDDSLRHAISKLAHVHLCATRQSSERLFALGEDRRRIHVVGAPGIDGVRADAAKPSTVQQFVASLGMQASVQTCALFLLHPTQSDNRIEQERARLLIDATRRTFASRIIALAPNNDPGSAGILAALRSFAQRGEIALLVHAERAMFLGMLRECRLLVGNSSSGIIEAGSFGTAVLDVGARQLGRERGPNVVHADWEGKSLANTVARASRQSRTPRADNPYDRGGAAKRIASILARIKFDAHLLGKVIRY